MIRGLSALQAMRRQGEKPAIVFIDVDAGPEGLPQWAQWQVVSPRLCDIDIPAGDSPARVDWRPLIGLTVDVSGTDERRVLAVAKAAHEAGASRVISVLLEKLGCDEWVTYRVVWMRDTAATLTEGADGAALHG